jgi:hypothetical protein
MIKLFIFTESRPAFRSEIAVQNRLGDFSKDYPQDGCRPRRLHRSEPVAERPHRRTELRKVDLDALLRLETRTQDR